MDDATLIDTSRAPSRSVAPAAATLVTTPEAGRTTVLPRVTLGGNIPQLVSDTRARFEPGKELGRGGVGEVILARDHDINRSVAIKRLLPELDDPGIIARFVEEIRTLGSLDHPNIVPIHDVGIGADGRYYYVMKYVEGETLENIIDRLIAGDADYHQRYPFGRRVEIFRQILNGVQYAHERGVIHRDIKPANVMIGRYGEVVVMDWGLARQVRAGDIPDLAASDAKGRPDEPNDSRSGRLRTMTGSLLGTPAYMSPEQARGDNDKLDERSDIYSLSVMFHELLCLRHYLAGRDSVVAAIHGVLHVDVPFAHFVPNPHQPAVPPDLSHFIRHGVEKDRAKRYGSVREMVERMQRIEDGHCPVECPSTFLKRVGTETAHVIDRRPSLVLGVLFVLLVFGVFGLADFIRGVT